IVVRWRTIIAAGEPPPGWTSLAGAILVGQATNIVFPFRAGELARGYALARSRALPFPVVLATIAVERLAGMVGVLAGGLVLSSVLRPSALPRLSSRRLWITLAAVGLAAIALAAWRRVPGLDAIRDWIVRRVSAAAPAFAGLRVLGHRHRIVELAALTALVIVLGASTNYVLFLGAGLALPPSAALALLVVLQVGTSVAS